MRKGGGIMGGIDILNCEEIMINPTWVTVAIWILLFIAVVSIVFCFHNYSIWTFAYSTYYRFVIIYFVDYWLYYIRIWIL